MEQPPNFTGVLFQQCMVSLLEIFLYGARKAGRIWEALYRTTLRNRVFKVSQYDPRLFFLRRDGLFVTILLVVDDIAFASNSQLLLESVEEKLNATFDVKIYGELKSFIRW